MYPGLLILAHTHTSTQEISVIVSPPFLYINPKSTPTGSVIKVYNMAALTAATGNINHAYKMYCVIYFISSYLSLLDFVFAILYDLPIWN